MVKRLAIPKIWTLAVKIPAMTIIYMHMVKTLAMTKIWIVADKILAMTII